MSQAVGDENRAIETTGKILAGYFKRSELPLYSLVFLLPAMILFEVGTHYHADDPIAFRMLELFFVRIGATSRFVPALCVAGMLLTWHIARKDAWHIQVDTLWGMAIESVILSAPLLALGVAVSRWNVHAPLGVNGDTWRNNAVLSLGAGIYEEFIFRFALMTLITMLVADLLGVHKSLSNLLMVATSAVLFSLYHYLGAEAFQLRSFVFRTAAGIYFAVLFLTRGFGVTAGCHIAYDIIIITIQAFALH
jgi:hypothetical protein